MANHVKIVIVNETDFGFAATGEGNDFVMETGTLAPGSHLPPPVLEPKQTCNFEVMTPLGDPGPEGYLRYEFEMLKMRVWINWTDATKTAPGEVTEEDGEKVVGAVNPFSYTWRLLDGGIGELDPVSVKLTDEKRKLTPNDLAKLHRDDTINQAKLNKWKVPVDTYKTLTATFTLRVKNAQVNVAPPAVTPAVMPASVVRPTGGSKAVIGTAYRTWDAPGISQRRKKLLAVVGNQFPQIYVPPGGKLRGVEPRRSVPYQKMTNWKPGNGTSCTSINALLEGIITGKASRWAFAAYHLEEAWVPWGANPAKPMPNVGDIYLLYRDIVADKREEATDSPHMRHCGVIAYVPEKPGEDWITADGGQTVHVSGDAAYLNRRPWEMREPSQPTAGKKRVWDQSMKACPFARPIETTQSSSTQSSYLAYPYLGGGSESKGTLADANRLIGWLDLDSLAINFKSEAFDTPKDEHLKIQQDRTYTEYDYQFLGAWIDDLLGKRSGALAPWLAHLQNPQNSPPPWTPAAPP